MATLFYIEGKDGQEDFDIFSNSDNSGKLSWDNVVDEAYGLEFADLDDPDIFDENDKQFNVRPKPASLQLRLGSSHSSVLYRFIII